MAKKSAKQGLPDWLPEGWTIRIRPRRRSDGNIKCDGGVQKYPGGTYTCYIAPITNLKFYSKPEVLRYLHSRNKRTRFRTKSANGNTNKSTCKPAKFPEMDGSQKVIRSQLDENQAKHSEGREVDKVPDCKLKKKYTKGAIKRTGTLMMEKNRVDKTTEEGNFPEMNGSSMTDIRDNGLKQPTELQVDQLMEKKMNNAAHEGGVDKLNDRNVANSERLKGMNCSEVHIREERTRNILKGQVLHAGYIIQSQGTLRSVSNGENAAELIDSPFHYVMTDPCIVFTRSTSQLKAII